MDTSNSQQAPLATSSIPSHPAPALENASSAEPESGSATVMSGALPAADSLDAPKSAAEASETAPNGIMEPAPEEPSTDTKAQEPTPSEPAPTAAEDAEMADESAPAAPAEQAALETNGTPASSKKQSNGKRKSTGGVPEHKTKKLNKKKSQQKITHLDAQPGEFYFARLKSYPPWPSIICDEEMLPHSLLSTRPVTTKQKDGTYKDAYADGGKNVTQRTFPVMFLHTNEFAWIPNTDLTPLNPEELKDFSEKGKSKSLIAAYKVAAEDQDLQYFKNLLREHAQAIQEDIEEREAREAVKAAKAERKKRKSEPAGAAEDVDMEDVGDDEGTAKPPKKRKKDVNSEGDEEKPSKTPKTTQKLKLTTPKAPGTAEKKGKDSAKASRAKSEKRKSTKAAVSDEEMADEEVKEPPKPVDPVEERKAREKEVLFLRHKLQKGFLSRDQAPQESEMASMSNFIKKLEAYGDLEVSIIRSTKINKVLKALIKLNTIPKDEEYNFRGRSVELISKWNKLLGSADDGAGDKSEKPTTNGAHEDKEGAKKQVTDKPTEEPEELNKQAQAVGEAPATSEGAKKDVVHGLTRDAAEEGPAGDKMEITSEDSKDMTKADDPGEAAMTKRPEDALEEAPATASE